METRSEAQATGTPDAAPAPVATARRPPRPTPVRVPELLHLDLVGLRVYRQELADEETRVSYWRRIIQARLDLLVSSDEDPDAVARLRRVFGGDRAQSRSRTLLGNLDLGDTPLLPDLRALWASEAHEPAEVKALVARLTAAENQLSIYRTSLHTRIDLSTRELIARYREDPHSCLVALRLHR